VLSIYMVPGEGEYDASTAHIMLNAAAGTRRLVGAPGMGL